MTEPEELSPRPDTLAVRAGLARSHFDETSEALYLNSGYVYGSAAEAKAAFDGDIERFRYSRVGSPTVRMLEDRFAAMHGAEAVQATATGMAAVFNALLAVLPAGGRLVASRSLFGSCFVIVEEILPGLGMRCEVVDGSDLAAWEEALDTPADAVFCESPSNPMQDLTDIAAVSEMAHSAGATVVVDSAFASPVFQRPLDLGADVAVFSTTKHMDGGGRTLGGLIAASRAIIDEIKPLIRHTGPSMSPFNAWVVLKSLDTLRLRVEHAAVGALHLASWLDAHPRVRWVRHPFHPSHPQHDLALRQMSGGGTVVTFEIDGDEADAFSFLDALRTIDISNNFADTKSLICHPASTTHNAVGPEARRRMGIGDGVIRLSVGLEDVEDLREDLDSALRPAPSDP